MCHSDDDGLRLPPRIATKQIVIIPIVPKPELEAEIFAYADVLAAQLKQYTYHGRPLTVHVDKRDKRGGEKSWEWIKKGVPVRIEIGPKDLEANVVTLARRDKPPKEKYPLPIDQVPQHLLEVLEEIQKNYYRQADAYRQAHVYRHLETFNELKQFFTPKNEDKPEIHGGFVVAKWCGDPSTEEMLKDLKVTIRCLPLEQTGTEGHCILTGRRATLDAIFAKSY